MKLIDLLTTAILGLTLAGCTTEELDSLTNTQQNAIGFSTLNTHVGRAIPITSENITNYDFNVYAFTQDGKAFMGTNDNLSSETFSYGGINISYKNGKWEYTTPSDLRYWPTEDTPLNFYAVCPGSGIYTSDYRHGYTYGWRFCSSEQTIEYTPYDEYSENNTGNIPSNIDVMYAIAPKQTKSTNTTNAGIVPLKFNHILSQIVFKAQVVNANITVVINSIQIHNAKIAGKFKLPLINENSNIVPTATSENWTYKTAQSENSTELVTHNNYVAISNAKISLTHSDNATDITKDNPLLLIPQKLIPWDVTNKKDIELADNAEPKQSYLEIKCSIKNNGTYIHGNEHYYASLYMPFSANWQPGKRYIYTIKFGGGYTNLGEPILSPINFEASTEGWVESESNTNK